MRHEAGYYPNTDGRLWWCNSHGRKATYIQIRADGEISPHCDIHQNGILLPCDCVDLTEEMEIEE